MLQLSDVQLWLWGRTADDRISRSSDEDAALAASQADAREAVARAYGSTAWSTLLNVCATRV